MLQQKIRNYKIIV